MPQVKNFRVDDRGVYVGRPSKWGNPFSHLRVGASSTKFHVPTRDAAVDAYEKWIVQRPELMASLHELRGKDLVCWCAPRRCHADVLLRLANAQS